jgi:hypothetical protein
VANPARCRSRSQGSMPSLTVPDDLAGWKTNRAIPRPRANTRVVGDRSGGRANALL